MKKFFPLILSAFMLMPVTAYANSAPTRWRGSDSTSIIINNEDCPVIVEKERLTFDINSLPTGYHSDTDSYTGAKFTAEYTLHNPTDMDVTATVLFPFGTKGDYYDESYMYGKDFVEENYLVQIDGQDIVAEKRYTFFPYNYREFDIDRQIKRISDEYIGDDFFNPDQKVTKFEVDIDKIDREDEIYLTWQGKNDGAVLFTYSYTEGRFEEDKLYLTIGDGSWFDVVYFVIGDGENRPDVKIINRENLAGVSAESITSTEEMTLRDFIKKYVYTNLNYYDLPRADFDNIVSDIFTSGSKGNNNRNFAEHLGYYNIPSDLMCWYKYDITIPSGETVVNTVTAPLFPDVNTGYEPDIFTYNYLLSPAKRWADFKNLQVVINTPYYITESSLDFEKTETGYKNTFDILPDKELAFTVSQNPKPVKEVNYRYLVFFLPLLIIPVFVAIFILLIIKFSVKKKK